MIQYKTLFKNEIKNAPSGFKYVFIVNDEFFAKQLISEKCMSVLVTQEGGNEAFTIEEFNAYMTEVAFTTAKDYFYLPLLTKEDNKKLINNLALAHYEKVSKNAWRIFSKKGGSRRDYFRVHPDELREQATKFIESIEQAGQSLSLNSFYNENGKLLHNVLGDYILNNYNMVKIGGRLHIWDNGLYKADDEQIQRAMIELLPDISMAKRKETLTYMQIKCQIEKDVSPPHLIPFKSKIFDVYTEKFIDYSPEYVFLNRLPYDYNPAAKEQKSILNTINDIANNDSSITALLYEAIGYCLFRGTPFRGAVMLYGESGNNGKSTLLNLIRQMLGDNNVSSLSLQDLSDRFRLSGLYGMLANIGDDIPSTYIDDSSQFKKLVTGEAVMIEEKYKPSYSYKNHAKMFFATNSLPRINDKTKALMSRFLVIPLTKDFSKEAAYNPDLKDKKWSSGEMEYLIKLAISGLKRLLLNRKFTESEAVQAALRDYETINNPTILFLEEYPCDIDGKETNAVYESYKNWCYDSGVKAESKITFSKTVCREMNVKTKPKKIDGTTKRIFAATSDYEVRDENPFIA
ncbi:phage/plasmid primase, P4 family [Tyzzerella sp. OttesenSCG-928-J15]|nr:phage/plasmid primase, P4 family [Tyzzerella sp. OttesenSCG-928-J15]